VGCALALSVALSLAAGATADLELGMRAEGRSTTLAPSRGPTVNLQSAWAVPSAAVRVDAPRLRVRGTYAPRIWTSDLETRPSPLVNHFLEAHVETSTAAAPAGATPRPVRDGGGAAPADHPWRLEATASAMRGETDPLADPALALGSGAPSQVATAKSLPYESARTGGRGEVHLDARTILGAGAEWNASRATSAEGRALLPGQWTAALDAFLARRVTERDTLRGVANAARTSTEQRTDATAGDTTSVSGEAFATWRRRLTPFVDGWIGGGAGIAYVDEPGVASTRDIHPTGELGVARAGASLRVVGEAMGRATTFVDRFTGEVSPSLEGRCTATWLLSNRLSLRGAVSGMRRTDGETALAAGDVWFAWMHPSKLTFEAGLSGRRQYERRPEVPSFRQGGVFLAVGFGTVVGGRPERGAVAR
jgi:hypothetical protein